MDLKPLLAGYEVTVTLRYEVDGEVLETAEDRLRIEAVPDALELVIP